jgi:hypothetical protein
MPGRILTNLNSAFFFGKKIGKLRECLRRSQSNYIVVPEEKGLMMNRGPVLPPPGLSCAPLVRQDDFR